MKVVSILGLLSLIWEPCLLQVVPSCQTTVNTCSENPIRYFLYRRDLATPFEILNENIDSIMQAPLTSSSKLILILHGFTGHKDYSPNMELRPAYFAKDDYNIISVDYEPLVRYPCYPDAVINTRVIGNCVARFLATLHSWRTDATSIENTHVIGFSLGAQIAGILGYHYFRYTQQLLPRITGLDPAFPFYGLHITSRNYKLDFTDAEFVDIIHSSGGTKGILLPEGHIDFYLNNGATQPGCLSNSSCHHVRAVEVFAESINSVTGIWGMKCQANILYFIIILNSNVCEPDMTKSPLVLLGEHVPRNMFGTYIVYTRDKFPYAQENIAPLTPSKQLAKLETIIEKIIKIAVSFLLPIAALV